MLVALALVGAPLLFAGSAAADAPDVEWCEEHTQGPMGQPQILPYPCKVRTSGDLPVNVDWCEKHTTDPWGMPVIVPYPCATVDTSTPEMCYIHGKDPFGMPVLVPYPCLPGKGGD